jgi:hypothetical protein
VPFTLYYELAVPANTTYANRKRTGRKLPAGARITSVTIDIPAGHQSTTPIWFEHRGSKILPTDGGEIALDNVPGRELLPKGGRIDLASSGDLDLVGYNTDAGNAHTARAIVAGLYKEELGGAG